MVVHPHFLDMQKPGLYSSFTNVHLSLNISKILHSLSGTSESRTTKCFSLSLCSWFLTEGELLDQKRELSKIQGLPPLLSFPPKNLQQWGLALKCPAVTVLDGFSRRSHRHKSKAVTVSLWLQWPTRAASRCQYPRSHNRPSRTLYGIQPGSRPAPGK